MSLRPGFAAPAPAPESRLHAVLLAGFEKMAISGLTNLPSSGFVFSKKRPSEMTMEELRSVRDRLGMSNREFAIFVKRHDPTFEWKEEAELSDPQRNVVYRPSQMEVDPAMKRERDQNKNYRKSYFDPLDDDNRDENNNNDNNDENDSPYRGEPKEELRKQSKTPREIYLEKQERMKRKKK